MENKQRMLTAETAHKGREGPSPPDFTPASMEGPRYALHEQLHEQFTSTGGNLEIINTHKHKGEKPNCSQTHHLEINAVGVWGFLL